MDWIQEARWIEYLCTMLNKRNKINKKRIIITLGLGKAFCGFFVPIFFIAA
jgi:hypothetical protein